LTLFAFLAVYLLWGSNYLAMKIGVESIPPLMLAGVRSLIGGLLLFGWGRWRGGAGPTRREWGIASIIGGCMFLGAHGGLFWAIQRVPSGVASLFVATVPIWMTFSQRLTEPQHHIGARTLVGIAGGALGLVVLVGPGQFVAGEAIEPAGAVVLIGVAIAWTIGSTIARRTAPPSISVATGSYLLAGGSMLMVVSWLVGEFPRMAAQSVTGRSVVALGYLIVCGSLIAFSAYNYLLRHSTLAKVSTYAYVNPLVAIALGWAFGGESLNARIGIAAALIIGSVALSLSATGKPPAVNR
jgi:drug/metabolite transporter (DMT)-like permease